MFEPIRASILAAKGVAVDLHCAVRHIFIGGRVGVLDMDTRCAERLRQGDQGTEMQQRDMHCIGLGWVVE